MVHAAQSLDDGAHCVLMMMAAEGTASVLFPPAMRSGRQQRSQQPLELMKEHIAGGTMITTSTAAH